jgi:hypothetical protein
MEQQNQQVQRQNGNTHVRVNIRYLSEVFFQKYYYGIMGDVFNILLIIVYFRTMNLHNDDQQTLLQNSIIATLFTYGAGLLLRTGLVLNALRYYGQNLRIEEANEKVTFETNKIYLWLAGIFGTICIIPRIPIMYYFIPLTKTAMCDLYGPSNCDMLKAFSVVTLMTSGVFAISLFALFLAWPNYLTGTPKNIVTFIRDNIFGLLCGNVVNSINVTYN